MKAGWEIKKLSEVCKLYQPKTISVEMFVEDGEYFVYGANGIIGHYNQYNHEDSEVLLTCRGATCGSVNISEPYSWINGNAMVVKPLDKNNIKQQFLKYYLISVDWNDIITGAAQPQITRLSLSPLPIPVPPLPEQERIVSELDLISGVIDKKKQQLKELDSLAQSIFYEMFGNPDDSVFPLQCLSSLSNHKLSYGSGASAVEYDGKVRYIRITDIKEDGYLDDNIMSPNDYEDKYLLNDGDILFARSGATVGKTYHYKKSDGMAIYAGYLIRFIPNQDLVLPTYIYYYTRSSYYHAFVKKSAQAVAQPNINAKQYGELQVCVPPLSLQQEFASMIEKIERQKELIKHSLQETETLFNSRMDYYFNS
ncbi:MAG: hypothetical protein E7068_08040 [Lentimicrobiaceae bacterium]|nr:hypothetical protein [Lentimicrobiaceae bacterium]